MNEQDLYADIHEYCETHADPALVKKYSRFFREGYDAYGLTRELMEDKAGSLLNDERVTIDLVVKASPLLVKSGKYEEVSFAILLLKGFSEQFTDRTFREVSAWFDIGIINWAHTDIICGMLMPSFFGQGIITLESFSDWRTSPRKYKRRAVPVAMLELLKTADDYTPLYAFIEPLMMDSERVVQQGLGWLLREAWKLKREETEIFLTKWKNDAPRLIYQYATEKMTKEEKERFRREKRKKA